MKKFNDIAYRVSFISIILNILLSIIKFIAGIIGNSQAMISDSIHSLTDVISTFVVIIGIYASKKKADNKYQYGHERYECLSAIILSFILIINSKPDIEAIAIGILLNIALGKNVEKIFGKNGTRQENNKLPKLCNCTTNGLSFISS